MSLSIVSRLVRILCNHVIQNNDDEITMTSHVMQNDGEVTPTSDDDDEIDDLEMPCNNDVNMEGGCG